MQASLVVVHSLSCPVTCGILVPQPVIEPSSLHWKADSYPLDHQGSPCTQYQEINHYGKEYFEIYIYIFVCVCN